MRSTRLHCQGNASVGVQIVAPERRRNQARGRQRAGCSHRVWERKRAAVLLGDRWRRWSDGSAAGESSRAPYSDAGRHIVRITGAPPGGARRRRGAKPKRS